MSLVDGFNQKEHDQVVIDCFFTLWHHSADFMFIMAAEENGEFSLFDNNPASKAVMGLPLDVQIHRMNIRETWGDEIVKGLYGTYQEAIKARKPISILQNATNTERDICVDTLLVPIFNSEGEAIYVCGVSRDITNIKDAESIALEANEKLLEYSEALKSINQDLDRKVHERTQELETAKYTVEESLKAKSSFVARMSHEIRTPINAILGLSHLALNTPLNGEQEDYIKKIAKSGETLLSLINDVLDFSKIEAGEMHVEKIPFSPQNIVEHAITMNSIQIEDKKLMVTVDISPSLPEYFLGDPLRIQQILVNLITNAVKFTHHGGIGIRLYAEKSQAEQYLLRCDVIDTGIGISKEFCTDLFKSFQQADDSVTRQYGGTGLGLTISHQLCELMGGEIWVNSELGQGSTFSFVIPVQETSNTVATTKIGSTPNLSEYKVLIVEDNAINQKVILGYLEETFIKADIAENGEEAINKIYANKYDLILMDIQMPVMDGLTATQVIRQSPSYQNLPIIAMTAHVSQEAKEQSSNVGMNEHLDKPIKKSKLYKILQKHLQAGNAGKSTLTKAYKDTPKESSHYKVLSNLSSIDTLDFEHAINHFDGKTSLYIELVSAFVIKYQYFSITMNDDIKEILHALKANTAYIGALTLSSQCVHIEQCSNNHTINSNDLINLEKNVIKLIKDLEIALDVHLTEKNHNSKSEFCSATLTEKLQSIVPLLQKSDFFVENHFPLLRKMTKGTKYALDIEHLIHNIKNVEFEIAEAQSSQLILELQGNSCNGDRTTSISH